MAKTIRILTLLMALLMSFSLLVACGNKNNEDETTGGTQTGGNVTQGKVDGESNTGDGELSDEDIEREMYRPERLNCGTKDGPYEYVVGMASTSSGLTTPSSCFFYNEQLEGDALNTALADRASFLEEYLNIAIVQNDTVATAVAVSTQTSAGVKYADIVHLGTEVMNSNVKNGHFLDLAKVDELNLEASYWDSRIQENLNVNGHIFGIDGALTTYDEMRTMAIIYNASLYENYGYKTEYGSPYSIVDKKQWTFDTMLEMYQGTSRKLGTGDSLGRNDVWGMISELTAPYYLFLGSGMKVAKTNDGVLEVMFDSDFEAIYNVFEHVMVKLVNDAEVLIQNNHKGVLTSGSHWQEGNKMFEEGLALFKTGAVGDAAELRNMRDEFGILPIPMYSSGQDGYHCLAGGGAFYMPITVKTNNLQLQSATILEALGFFSKYMDGEQSVYDAFFENMTYVKLCRTEEDRNMLILMIESKVYDINSACGFADISTVLQECLKRENISTLSSDIGGLRTPAVTNLVTYLEFLEKNVKN